MPIAIQNGNIVKATSSIGEIGLITGPNGVIYSSSFVLNTFVYNGLAGSSPSFTVTGDPGAVWDIRYRSANGLNFTLTDDQTLTASSGGSRTLSINFPLDDSESTYTLESRGGNTILGPNIMPIIVDATLEEPDLSLSFSDITQTGLTVGFTNSGGIADSQTFEYGTTTAYGTTEVVTATQDQVVLTGLDPDEEYFFRVIATNSTGSDTVTDSFSTLAQPVTLQEPFAVSATTIVFRANRNSNAAFTMAGFQYGTTAALGEEADFMGAFAANGTFTVEVTGLTAETTYHYRAFVSDGTNEFFTEIVTATTSALPLVIGDVVVSVATNPDGDVTVTTNGGASVYYISQTNPGSGVIPTTTSGITVSGNAYTVPDVWPEVSTLIGRSTYIAVRITDPQAVNFNVQLPAVLFLSNQSPSLPSITVAAASNPGTTTFTINGAINSTGVPATSAEFRWGTASDNLINTEDVFSQLVGGYGLVSADLTGLTLDTPYFYNLYANGLAGPQIVSFTTSAQVILAPTITITDTAAADISTSGASIRGTVTDQNGGTISTVRAWHNTTNSFGTFNNQLGTYTGATATNGLERTSGLLVSLSSLSAGTTYYVRLGARNESGWSNLPQDTFDTEAVTITYSPQYVNSGTPFRNELAVQTLSACNASTDDLACGTSADEFCPSPGTETLRVTYSNTIVPQTWTCVGSDGSHVDGSLCSSNGGIAFGSAGTPVDTGSGASIDDITQACSIQVDNTRYVEPEPEETFGTVYVRDTNTITGGVVNVTNETTCVPDSTARPTCAVTEINCSAPGSSTETFDRTEQTVTENQVCRSDLTGLDVAFSPTTCPGMALSRSVVLLTEVTDGTRPAVCGVPYPNLAYQPPVAALTVAINGGTNPFVVGQTTAAFGVTVGGTLTTGVIGYAWGVTSLGGSASIANSQNATTTLTGTVQGAIRLEVDVTRGSEQETATMNLFIG